MTAPVDLIRENLPHLVHPGDGKGPIPLPLPMFRNSAIPAHMAKDMAEEAGLPSFDIAKLTAEAIVALLEQNGWRFIQKVELGALREAAAAGQDRHRRVEVTCTCGTSLFVVDVDVDKPTLDGSALIRALSRKDPACPHGRVD
ncbi:hypothetical protein JDBV06_00555 [Mycobacterium phage dwieneke]|nr:hypothetical protein JDBV06_00555 [Mycobacterium phage dwieneke]